MRARGGSTLGTVDTVTVRTEETRGGPVAANKSSERRGRRYYNKLWVSGFLGQENFRRVLGVNRLDCGRRMSATDVTGPRVRRSPVTDPDCRPGSTDDTRGGEGSGQRSRRRTKVSGVGLMTCSETHLTLSQSTVKDSWPSPVCVDTV